MIEDLELAKLKQSHEELLRRFEELSIVRREQEKFYLPLFVQMQQDMGAVKAVQIKIQDQVDNHLPTQIKSLKEDVDGVKRTLAWATMLLIGTMTGMVVNAYQLWMK